MHFLPIYRGWLGWGGGASKPKPPEEKMEISSNLPMSTNIPDYRRSVLSVCVSPLGNLAAMVDCFGRVLLLDCEALVIRRMWKGVSKTFTPLSVATSPKCSLFDWSVTCIRRLHGMC